MLDIKLIRDEPKLVERNNKNRGYDINLREILQLDGKWRELKKQNDKLRNERNKISQNINQTKKQKKGVEAKRLIKKAKELSEKLKKNEEKERELKKQIEYLVSVIPNIQDKGIPIGDEKKNKEVLKWGKIPKIKNVKSHLELGRKLDIIDIKRSAKISGEGFYILKGKGAKLQRALVQFMMDFHEKNKLTEINPPKLVNKKSGFGTGNLPKFENELYFTKKNDLVLIPTAEVSVTNIYAEETLREKDLPKKFFAFTECYRTETGKHMGEKGLFRLHEFEKVEMVYICKQEDSWKLLEEMTKNAEQILKKLNLHYKKFLLATKDASFASAKTYDLEIWSPAMKKYLEISSCSNCTDFQARRMNTRYQSKDGKIKFVHTLNGSGLALPRLMICLIENNQTPQGGIKVPKALWKYTGFKEIKPEKKIEKKKIKKKVIKKRKRK